MLLKVLPEHAFIKEDTKKPSRPPAFFIDVVKPYYKHKLLLLEMNIPDLEKIIRNALAEDMGEGDITTLATMYRMKFPEKENFL